MPLKHYAGRLAYDGTAYFGFQRQKKGVPTIQSTLEDILVQMVGHPVTVSGAGRTDTGVHASGQVIAWWLDWKHSHDALLRAINFHLPPDIALQSLFEVGERFHPRFEARCRTYIYRMLIASLRDPLRERFVWRWEQALDVKAMQAAVQLLIGEHDFATFGMPPQGESTVRRMTQAQVQTVGDEIHYTFAANAFLQRMVRALVGSLVKVGMSRWTVDSFRQAFEAHDRNKSGPCAPARGLTLSHVEYQHYVF